ncbi:MAG TPA: primosomal protein N' [Candidatus Limnocylindrales bacterium]|nr:primosomal protein N' [Candidatus Limnocylindrales bacterium]
MSAPRLVSVAVDAAGAAGQRSYTYLVPAALAGLEPGEAVLADFGRRQALGIVLGAGEPVEGVEAKPILDRVRADGPLLPPLAMQLAAWISDHYLAPPAITLRAMLPPGMLERLELVAERRPGTAGHPLTSEEAALLAALDGGPRQVRSLDAPEGRPALLRRLRGLEGRGLIDLDWTLLASGAGPRWVRDVRLAKDPLGGPAAPKSTKGLGPRQLAVLEELRAVAPEAIAAPELAARHGSAAIASLARRGLVTLEAREAPRRPLAARAIGARGARPAGSELSPEQVAAVENVAAAAEAGAHTTFLLDGVTGGGKTAIYVELLAASLARGRPGLVLVPEIALALPLVDRLRADLDARVAVLHSGLGDGERADEWRRIRRGEVEVVVGTRLAVLAPLADVGVVIVDEEHDAAYKSDRTPRLQARDAAIELARLAGAPVVLGSATPSVETEGRARDGSIVRHRLPERLSGAPPSIEVVDLRAELAAGNLGMLSRPLAAALAELAGQDGGAEEAGDQAILVINRRGTASVVLCRDCGYVATCPDCTRPLVYHQAGGTLRCHHCGRAWPMPSRCPQCQSARIRYLGGGTERVEREVRDRFPGLRVGRLDRDVVERKGAAERVIDAFTDHRLDVLVGTSLVTKGLDIPAVTLVGIVSADVALNLPDERAAERTYQLLAQAVGRAGRGDRPGHAVIQTYQPEHPAIVAVAEARAEAFYDAELDLRRRFGSPPFGRLVKLTAALPDRDDAERTARELADALRARAEREGRRVQVSGPAPAFVAKRGDRWRFNVILRGGDPVGLLGDPPGVPWSIDVDPETLL